MKEMLDGFFGESPEFWIGKVVSIDAQKQTAQGLAGDGDTRCVFLVHIQIVTL